MVSKGWLTIAIFMVSFLAPDAVVNSELAGFRIGEGSLLGCKPEKTLMHPSRIGHPLEDDHPVEGGEALEKKHEANPSVFFGRVSSEVLSVVDDD
jgi:hypothetical protein